MDKPSYRNSSRKQPNQMGWAFAALIFSLLIFSQLTTIFLSSGEQSLQSVGKKGARTGQFAHDYDQLENAIMMKELYSMLGHLDKEKRHELAGMLDSSISKLVDYKYKIQEAAALYMVMRYEQGKEIMPDDLILLTQSKDPADQALAKIYASSKLSLGEAKSLSAQLTHKNFLSTLGKVHAFEKAGDSTAKERYYPFDKWYRLAYVGVSYSLLVVLGLVFWVIFFKRRDQGKWKAAGSHLTLKSIGEANRNMLRVGLGLFWVIALPVVLATIADVDNFIVKIGVSAVEIYGVVYIFKMRLGGKLGSFKKLLGQTKNFAKLALFGVGAAIANLPIVLALGAIGMLIFRFLPEPTHPVAEKLAENPSASTIIWILFSASVLAPIIEELIFRGLLFPALSFRYKNARAGAVVSSLLFAAVHPQGITLWLALAGVGFMSCMLIQQTRSLVPSIFMHATHNFLTIVFSLLILS